MCDIAECVCSTCVFVSAFLLLTAYLYVIDSDVILFTFNSTGVVDIDVESTVPNTEELTDEEKKIMNKVIRDVEERFVTHLREFITELKGHDQESKESIEQAVRKCRQAKGKVDGDCYIDELQAIIEERIPKVLGYRDELQTITKERIQKVLEQLVHYFAKLLAHFMIIDIEVDIDGVRVKHSIAIRCRCKTTDGLLDLDKLVASGELDELFSLAMSCLINQPAAASVSISQQEFKNCLKSLTADAG